MEVNLYPFPKKNIQYNVAIFFPGPIQAAMASLAFHSLIYKVGHSSHIKGYRFIWDENGLSSLDGADLNQMDMAFITSSFEFDYIYLMKISLQLKSLKIPNVIGGMSPRINRDFFWRHFDVVFLGQMDDRFDTILNHIASVNELTPSSLRDSIFEMKIPAVLVNGKEFDRDFHKDGTATIIDREANFTPHTTILTPDSVFGNSFLVEVSTGCRRRCAFCVLSEYNKPHSTRDESTILPLLDILPEGFDGKIGLVSAALTDFPDAAGLIKRINERGFKVNTSSLRMEQLTDEQMELIKFNGQKTLTLAPETVSKHLRKLIGKAYKVDHLYNKAQKAGELGFSKIKLYYMTGLPGETDEDVEALIQQVAEVRQYAIKGARLSGINPEISLSVNPFIPKPATRIGTAPYEDTKVLKKRLNHIRSSVRKIGNIKMDWDSPRLGRIQHLIACHIDLIEPLLMQAAIEDRGTLWLEKATRGIIPPSLN